MRHVTRFSMVLVMLVPAVAPATAATKVFLLGGQSNMSGFQTGLPTTAPYNAPLPDVRFWNYSNNGWIDLQPGLGDTSNDIGPEIGFGHKLSSLFPDDDIYFIKHGALGTSLAVDWNPNGTGPQYNTFKSRVNTALANLNGAGLSFEIAGMIWMQGESDANNAAYGAAYAANLANFIDTVRSDFAAPDMPFVVGRITDLTSYGFPAVTEVRTAQETVPGTVGNAMWIDTDDVAINPAQPGHYSASGQIALGTRFANAITGNTDSGNGGGDGTIKPGTSAVTFDANSGTAGYNANTVGWRFGVSETVTVTRLGCLNGVVTGGDGRAGAAHGVGIYDETSGQLLGGAVVTNSPAGGTDQWSWTNLAAPLTLTAGNVYRIATHPNGDSWTYNTANHAVGTEILIGTALAPGAALEDNPGSRVAAYAPGDTLQYPSELLWDVSVIYDGIFGANFQYENGTLSGTRGVHATGTLSAGADVPILPENNLILQGSGTLTGYYTGGAAPASWGAGLGDMNNGAMTPFDGPVNTLLGWDGVTGDFGWVVYELDTTASALGYDVTDILSYAAWSDARVNQAIEIKYALVGDAIVEGEELGRTLGSFSYTPNSTGAAYTTLAITNDDGPSVLSGIAAIQIKYIDNLFNGQPGKPGNFSAYKQLAVIGIPTTGTVEIPGDLNGDGFVNSGDLDLVRGNWGTNNAEGDANNDGFVNSSDLDIIRGNWGATGTAAAVPEPGMAGLIALGALVAAMGMRKKGR